MGLAGRGDEERSNVEEGEMPWCLEARASDLPLRFHRLS